MSEPKYKVGDYVKMSEMMSGYKWYTTDYFRIEEIVITNFGRTKSLSYRLDRPYHIMEDGKLDHLKEPSLEFDTKTSRNMKLKSLGIE
jgi:hypothetical protein